MHRKCHVYSCKKALALSLIIKNKTDDVQSRNIIHTALLIELNLPMDGLPEDKLPGKDGGAQRPD